MAEPIGERPWQQKLAEWFSKVGVAFLNLFMVGVNPLANMIIKVHAARVRDDPNSTPDQKEFWTQILEGNEVTKTIGGWILAMISVIPALMGSGRPQGRVIEYEQDKKFESFRLDPISIITAWRRDPEKYAGLFDDLKDLGWNDDRIEALKFFTLFYPSPGDLVRWQAREVFEPNMIAKYGLKDELGELRREDFYKAGMSDEQIDNYWMAHWEHPEFRTVVEMLRRTDFSEEDMKAWFRLVEIPPFWRQKLIDISYEVPTRVDVRRFWDMRTIDEARLREIYAWQGYHGKDLDDYILWTKVYVAFPDLIARWKNGWITLDDVKRELTGYGMPAARVDELIETKIKSAEPERTASERDLTKTEIYKGVKKGLISWGEGIELLMDLGYDEDEADYILAVNIAVEAGSPESFAEFKDLTTKWRKSAGMEATPEVEELKQAAAEVVKLTRDLEILQAAIKEEERKLISEEILPEAATARRDELLVTLHRAESALAVAKSNYDRLIAEWRHRA